MSDAEDCDIRSYDQGFVRHNQPLELETSVAGDNYPNRATPGFLTGIVGDAGSCKIIRSVMERSRTYQWIGVIPGDQTCTRKVR